MKVYVVMGNDFPDAVFNDEASAEDYCAHKRPENPRIYWRSHEFDLQGPGPRIGDGSGDAALAIGEHAFKTGYACGWQDRKAGLGSFIERQWSEYDPPEEIKALS